MVLKCLDDEIVIDFIMKGGQMREVQASRKNIPIGGRDIRSRVIFRRETESNGPSHPG